MRWPLRNQIMLPMASVMLAALIAVSALNAWLSARRISGQIRTQLREVARTLDNSSFPLTDSVLRQMRGLSGAQFVLGSRQGRVLATSFEPAWGADVRLANGAAGPDHLSLGNPIRLAGTRYLQTTVALRGPARTEGAETLHIFYPQETYSQALWQAASPPLLVGVVAIGMVGIFAGIAAARVSRPLGRLQGHVERIARGEFLPIPLPKRNDELRDLAVSVNRMTDMLAGYEREVRRNERLRTLAQVGGGIAHQMRNAVTGCRMAIDLHARRCHSESEPDALSVESLDVARRQLSLMETHLQRFLAWGSPPHRTFQTVDLVALIDNLLPLVRPAADHTGVRLIWQPPTCRPRLQADAHGLEQMLLNVVLNAIEAASRPSTVLNRPVEKGPVEGGPVEARTGWVRLVVEPAEGKTVVGISDSGPGPASGIERQLFEPFATDKPDGTGLGLSVAREIAEQHGGSIHWRRSEGITTFVIELPGQQAENERVETSGRR